MFLLPKNKVRIERHQHIYVNENAVRPPPGTQIYCGNLPRSMLEYELFPYFSLIGEVYELRLMTDFSGFSRGYCFVTYTTEAHADQAVRSLHGYILKDRQLCVYKSWNNTKLFIYDIPNEISSENVRLELRAHFDGILNVTCNKHKLGRGNQKGWALVEFDNQRNANACRKEIWPRKLMSWGTTIRAEWARPLPDDNHCLDSTILFQNVPPNFGNADVYSLVKTRMRTNMLIEISKEPGSTTATLLFNSPQATTNALKYLNGLQYNGEIIEVKRQKLNLKKYDLYHSNLDPQILEEEGQLTYNKLSIDNTTTSKTIPNKLHKKTKPRNIQDTNNKPLFHASWDRIPEALVNPNDNAKSTKSLTMKQPQYPSHNLTNPDITNGSKLNHKLESHSETVPADYSFDDAYHHLFPDDPHYKPSANLKFNTQERWRVAYEEVLLLFENNYVLTPRTAFSPNFYE